MGSPDYVQLGRITCRITTKAIKNNSITSKHGHDDNNNSSSNSNNRNYNNSGNNGSPKTS